MDIDSTCCSRFAVKDRREIRVGHRIEIFGVLSDLDLEFITVIEYRRSHGQVFRPEMALPDARQVLGMQEGWCDG
jgi:hypothetical protein